MAVIEGVVITSVTVTIIFFFFFRKLFQNSRLYIKGILNGRPATLCLVNSGIESVFMKFLFYFIILFLFDWTWNFVMIIPLVLGSWFLDTEPLNFRRWVERHYDFLLIPNFAYYTLPKEPFDEKIS